MSPKIVLLSGPVCAGKSVLAGQLCEQFETAAFRTQALLRELHPRVQNSRRALQAAGARLDRTTRGAWVRDGLERALYKGDVRAGATVVVDAVRIASQIDFLRESYGRRVIHIHLTAPVDELSERYEARRGSQIEEFPSYDEVRRNSIERRVERLAAIADVVVNTDLCTVQDVVVRVAAHIGLYGREYLRLVDVIVGGQFGSEGKGHVASHLAPEYELLVRVGGPNAGHKVYREPDHYVFRQLPSGTLHSSAPLVLGPGAVLNVERVLREVADWSIEYDRLSIDPNAMIIADDDVAAERALAERIGSTAQGVGAATARKIMGRKDPTTRLARDEPALRPFIRDTCRLFDKAFFDRKRILLEGTQGTGLSIHHGPYPHVTSRDTTVAGCLAEAGISPSRVRKVIMVCRTYPIRVQSPAGDGFTSGPLLQEQQWAEVARRSGMSLDEILRTEKTSTTNRDRRVAEFDWTMLRKAASLNSPTDVALTFADYLDARNQRARRFEQLTDETIRFIEEVERIAAAPVSLISTRFHSRSFIDRRSW